MKKQFGDRLRELRIEKGLTQEELAKHFNTGKASISHYESNKRTPDADNISKYADYFDVSIDYILGKTDFRNRYFIVNNLKLIMNKMNSQEFALYINNTGISSEQIDFYLSGELEPSSGTLSIIADAVGIDLDFFYKENNSIEDLEQAKINYKNFIEKTKQLSSDIVSQTQEIIEIDLELFDLLYKVKDLPRTERQKIKEYMELLVNKYLK